MKMYLVSDNADTAVGMRLAGIEGVIVHEKDEFVCALDAAVKKDDVGIILVTTLLCSKYNDVFLDFKQKNAQVLIVEIPDRHSSGQISQSLSNYINEAVGIKI